MNLLTLVGELDRELSREGRELISGRKPVVVSRMYRVRACREGASDKRGLSWSREWASFSRAPLLLESAGQMRMVWAKVSGYSSQREQVSLESSSNHDGWVARKPLATHILCILPATNLSRP